MAAAETGELKQSRPPLIGILAFAVGMLWLVGALAAAVALIGVDRIQRLTVFEVLAVAAGALLPAVMAWFAGAAAHEAGKARLEARRLADAADRLLNPESSSEEAARRLAKTVRGEISTLDNALEQTLARLQDVQGQIAQQARAVDAISEQAKSGANQMITGMEREREELLRISRDLTAQAQAIGASISKHTQSISEAARKAESEVRAADQALDHRLTSFGAAAALITDRTQGLTGAAQASADSALRLETALSNALEVLAKATNLTDAARQSAEAAANAATSTAGAVRDTTARAVDDAKRAADLIRGEAASVEREAAIALERLRDAAEAAREAAVGARNAVEETRPAARPRVQNQSDYDPSWRTAHDPLEGPPPARGRREQQRPQREASPAPGAWTWRDLMGGSEDQGGQSVREQPAARRDAPPPRREHSGPGHPQAWLVTEAGLELDTIFSPSGLERIAQRARAGKEARRRAVQDAARDATRRLADYFAADEHAHDEAMNFLRGDGVRIAELLGRGRATMSADATRIFLLLDASIG